MSPERAAACGWERGYWPRRVAERRREQKRGSRQWPLAAGVGAWGAETAGGSGLPAARPLVKPCDRSLAAVAGVGRPAGVVGVAGMLGVLGMDGIAGGRMALPPDIPEAGLIGGMMPGLPLEVGSGWPDRPGFPPTCSTPASADSTLLLLLLQWVRDRALPLPREVSSVRSSRLIRRYSQEGRITPDILEDRVSLEFSRWRRGWFASKTAGQSKAVSTAAWHHT